MTTPLNGSLVKAFSILDLITDQRPELTAAIVAQELQISAATAHRFLATLEEIGILTSQRRGTYGFGHKMIQLGQLAEHLSPMSRIIQPIIDEASRTLGESVMAARLSRGGISCIATAAASRPISVNIKVGQVLDPLASAQGKIWLAEMSDADLEAWLDRYVAPENRPNRAALRATHDTVRVAGFALNTGDNEPDIGAVSVPVRGPDGTLIMTLSVFGMLSRFTPPLIDQARACLNSAAEQVTQSLYAGDD